MKNKKILWKTLLIMGFVPFILVLFYGLYSAITGFSGLCFCGNYYGFKAFIDSIIMVSYVFYPAYIIEIILIIVSLLKFKKII